MVVNFLHLSFGTTEKKRTFAPGKLHGQLPQNPPGLNRSKGMRL